MAFIVVTPLKIISSRNVHVASNSILSSRAALKIKPSRRSQVVNLNMKADVQVAGAGMRIIRQADESTIEQLGCRSWGTWGCEPSTFPWTYSSDEVCLILRGDFTVIPDDGSEPMDVKAGDIAYFPKGMSCKWEVRSEVYKHFQFGIKI